MQDNFRQTLRKRYARWVASRVPVTDSLSLNRRIIYVLPTGNGLMFLLAAGLVFIAAINYAVSLAFGLAFMMVSLFILSILYAYNNLNGLGLKSLPTAPVFCGEEASFTIEISRAIKKSHEAIEFAFAGHSPSHADLVAVDRDRVQVFYRCNKRGRCQAPILRVTTYFPLGICRAWSLVNLDLNCIVYPRPVAFSMEQFDSGGGGGEESALMQEGSEDFYGFRDYVPGDPLRQVAWKNVARGQGMQLKQFVDYVDSRVWLDWDMFYGFSVEERLSRLCYGVLKLSREKQSFGLKMPGVEIPPDSGAAHRDKLLRCLALYGIE
jgi:uncharacterized protein (DUF58 family)